MVSEMIFEVFFHKKSTGVNEPQGVANLDPWGMVGAYSFREEDFWSFSHYMSMGANETRGMANLDA